VQRGTGIAVNPELPVQVAPGVQRGTGIALTKPLLPVQVAPGVQRGTGIALTKPLLPVQVAPGVQRGTGIALNPELPVQVAPGVQRGTGIADTTAWWLDAIGTEPTWDVANAAVAPAIHIPRIRVFTAFMTEVLLNKSCTASPPAC
jgi:hypothetical protein